MSLPTPSEAGGFSRRSFLQTSLVTGGLVCLDTLGVPELARATAGPDGALLPAKVLLDMVHNNPGEKPFVTHYNDPALLTSLGYKGKVYELFEGAQFAIDWASVDPDVFPPGSPGRAWVDAKAAELDKLYSETKAKGLAVYCHTDMVVLPKALVEKAQIEKTFGEITSPDTQKYLRAAVQQMFKRFPQLDGLVIRIGETYLNGAPFHTGQVKGRDNPQGTVIPLMQLLREEVCEKLNKKIIFRSWLSFDTNVEKYLTVSNGVEPHPNLYIVVKHVEGDFFRGNAFSKVLGIGRHPQLVEVQCQREYEGKGAYPNYVARGVIEGFEEHPGLSIRKTWANPMIIGMFTWSRGGGWGGPFITNELWCDLNVYVLSKWAQAPTRGEEEIFHDYATGTLKLTPPNAALFRELCLLTPDAVYRGTRSTHNDIATGWTRDSTIGKPRIPKESEKLQRVLDEKVQAVQMWTHIVDLAGRIEFPDAATKEYVLTSCRYGLYLYQIYDDGYHLTALGPGGDKAELQRLLAHYDQSWADYRKLKEDHPSCGTLYSDTGSPLLPGIKKTVEEIRTALQA